MVKKAPRRTAERIVTVSLDLFNRFGEPNVSTTLISAELNISPGNLYYHFPAKDTLVNHLFDSYETAILNLLEASSDVKDVEDAWFFTHSLFELIWDYRFLYRDLNDLLSRKRHLETHFKLILERKTAATQAGRQPIRYQSRLPDSSSTGNAAKGDSKWNWRGRQSTSPDQRRRGQGGDDSVWAERVSRNSQSGDAAIQVHRRIWRNHRDPGVRFQK
jgi:AcrR family transcriptional regulator